MSESQKGKIVTKDKLIGMKVVSGEGELVGTIKDVGFTIGKAGIFLNVEDADGTIQDISWDNIQGAMDFVVLKPETQDNTNSTSGPKPLSQAQPMQSVQNAQPVQQNQSICPNCHGQLTYIPQYQRWYCYKCKKYA